MKMQIEGDTLRITEVLELGAENSTALRDQARSTMSAAQTSIDIDLSQTSFVDSCGLGTLIALHKTACSRRGRLRLLHPTPTVQQVLELTRLNRIFDIVKS
jgi:anti-sigma B factor antagonist